MLVRSFLSAKDLGLSELERSSLITVLGMMERGEIEGLQFNMRSFYFDVLQCHTPACICGWANYVSGREKAFGAMMYGDRENRSPELAALFNLSTQRNMANSRVRAATVPQAARALNNFLTNGEPNWEEAMMAP